MVVRIGLKEGWRFDCCASLLLSCRNIFLVLNLKRYEPQVKIRNTAVSEANSLDIEIQAPSLPAGACVSMMRGNLAYLLCNVLYSISGPFASESNKQQTTLGADPSIIIFAPD